MMVSRLLQGPQGRPSAGSLARLQLQPQQAPRSHSTPAINREDLAAAEALAATRARSLEVCLLPPLCSLLYTLQPA
jgi:hypothetical protein